MRITFKFTNSRIEYYKIIIVFIENTIKKLLLQMVFKTFPWLKIEAYAKKPLKKCFMMKI